MEVNTADETVSRVVPLTLPEAALMFAVPIPTPVASPPVEPPESIVATLVASELHVAVVVKSCVLESV